MTGEPEGKARLFPRRLRLPPPSMLLHYHSSLGVVWQRVRPSSADPPPLAVQEIDTLLKEGGSWEKLYAAEQAMVFFLPIEMIDVEINRRIDEAERQKLPSFAAHKKSADAAASLAPPALAQKQAVLTTLLDELHWLYTRRMVVSRVGYHAAGTLLGVAVVLFMFLFIPLIVAAWDQDDASIARAAVELLKTNALWRLFEVMAFGALGAYFSRLSSFQSQFTYLGYDDLRNAFRLRMLIVRLTYGMIGAIILYILMRGNLLSGDVFPHFEENGVVATKDIAKLLAWSFLGGFSERLVPDTLERTEAHANPPSANPPSANPPSANPPSANPPSANPPSANPPVANPPSANQPSANQPSANQPDANQPDANQPDANQPDANQPSHGASS
jgi:hypothetical protein